MSILNATNCRFCRGKLKSVLSLGKIPPVNFYSAEANDQAIKKYPLKLAVCTKCELLQLNTIIYPNQLFQNYHYQTGASKSLVSGLQKLAQLTINDLRLTANSKVLDIGSNDGTFLKFFKEQGIEILGIDPGQEVCAIAMENGIPTLTRFFNLALATQIRSDTQQFDLISSLHNLANIPDLNDFLKGIKLLLKPGGSLLIEVADADKMIEQGQFDSIYHEHYNYFTAKTLDQILNHHGFEVKKLSRNLKQGGAITVLASLNPTVQENFAQSKINKAIYQEFSRKAKQRIAQIKQVFTGFKGQRIVGFGAPAKAVVTVNACLLSHKKIGYLIDSTSFKQGKYLPGTKIPIFDESQLKKDPADIVWLFAWNYQVEILKKLKKLKVKKVVIPFPDLKVIDISAGI